MHTHTHTCVLVVSAIFAAVSPCAHAQVTGDTPLRNGGTAVAVTPRVSGGGGGGGEVEGLVDVFETMCSFLALQVGSCSCERVCGFVWCVSTHAA